MILKSGLLELKAFFLKKLKHLSMKGLLFKQGCSESRFSRNSETENGLPLCLHILATKILLLFKVLNVSVQGRVTNKRLWSMEGNT